MTKQQKENVIDFITERDAIVESMGNRPADVAYLDGAIDALRIAGVAIEYNSTSEKWVIY
jgi:hypothetical protein